MGGPLGFGDHAALTCGHVPGVGAALDAEHVVADPKLRHRRPGLLDAARCRHSLRPGGTYLTADLGFLYHVPLAALATRFVGSPRARLGIDRDRRADLFLVTQLVADGRYRPVIDRRYELDEIVEATRYVESGQRSGNVVLRVSELDG